MSNVAINKLTNANLFANGGSLLGRADEVTLPQIKTKPAEHTPLGLMGSLEYPSGIDKLEMNIKWNCFYPEVAKTFANPYKAIELQVRSSLETFESGTRTAEKSYACFVKGRCNDFPLGNYKASQNATFESNISVFYCKVELDGEVILEIDVEANIFKVNGEDLTAKYRENLGL